MAPLDRLAQALRALSEAPPGHELAAVESALGREPALPADSACVAALRELAQSRATERDELARARERAQMLSEASFEGIMINENGSVIDANQRMADMLGYQPQEMLGDRTLHECVAAEDLPGVVQRLRDKLEGGYLITGIRKDGSRFRAELLTKQGKLGARPVRVVAVRDVTDRERAALQLKQSETRLRELAEAAFELLVVSRDGIIVEVVGALSEVLGYRREQLEGRPVLDFVAAPELEATRVSLASGGRYQTTILSASGEAVPFEVVGVLTSIDGVPARLAGLRDLREVRRAERERSELEQQLARSQRLESLGVLAGGIAHDFNNLLVGVVGNADLLLDGDLTLEQRESVQAILSAGNRAATLTAQLLAYAGRGDLGQREPIDLGALLPELRSLLGAALSKKANVELSIGPGSTLRGNRATILQVLMNLLTNASDALGGAVGTIRVRSERVSEPGPRFAHALGAPVRASSGPWLLLEVSDSGAGMDEATKSRVFEPFFTTKSLGHGLGLAATLGIVAAHGGALVVDSAPGQGSTFALVLPATDLPAPAPPPEEPRRGASARVLVVDDEELVRRQVRRTLELYGYSVIEASDGASGLAMLERERVDLILLDVTMPDLDGTEVVRLLRARGLSVPIVLTSGYSDFPVESRLSAGAVQGFLSKPFTLAELLHSVQTALQADGAPALLTK
jgi:PAS domain S-box-containing protein